MQFVQNFLSQPKQPTQSFVFDSDIPAKSSIRFEIKIANNVSAEIFHSRFDSVTAIEQTMT